MGQEFSHYEVRRTPFLTTNSQRTHTFSHALTRAFSQPLPAGLQQPKASDEPKTAADDGPNPYGARTMSVVLRMNRAEQNAGNFKVRHSLDPSCQW